MVGNHRKAMHSELKRQYLHLQFGMCSQHTPSMKDKRVYLNEILCCGWIVMADCSARSYDFFLEGGWYSLTFRVLPSISKPLRVTNALFAISGSLYWMVPV